MNALQQWPLQTVAQHAPHLIGLMLDAPLIGVSRRWPTALHAVEAGSVADGVLRNRTFESACGKKNLRLLSNGELVARWPPRLKGMPASRTRCRDCYEATGRMRPRTEWKKR